MPHYPSPTNCKQNTRENDESPARRQAAMDPGIRDLSEISIAPPLTTIPPLSAQWNRDPATSPVPIPSWLQRVTGAALEASRQTLAVTDINTCRRLKLVTERHHLLTYGATHVRQTSVYSIGSIQGHFKHFGIR